MQHLPRIRKSLASMTIDNPERVKYFICLKMMGILPPLSKQLQNWTYSCHQDNKTVNPSSLYDILVASHSTSCQHYTIHFAYFHKHLMILFQIMLNFVHEILLKMIFSNRINGEVMSALSQIYPCEQYGHLYRNDREKLQQYWKNLIIFYQQNENKLPQSEKGAQLAAHYWNPTNYTNLDDILIPFQMRSPKKEISPLKYQKYRVDEKTGEIILSEPASYGNRGSKIMDTLYLRVKGSYPWSVRYSKWQPNSEIYKDNGELYVNDNGFKDELIYMMLEGRSNILRQSITKNQQNLKLFVQTYKSYLQKHNPIIRSRILKYFKQKNEQTDQLFNVATITQAQNIINYGGEVQYKGKNYTFGYISKKQIQNMAGNDLNKGLVKQYNLQMPHYTFARAFFYSKNLYQFLAPQQYYLQISHNLFHDKLGYIMNDGSFSLINMAFFPYHSWIDLCVELKIRQTRDLEAGKSFRQKRFIQKMSMIEQRKMQYKIYTSSLNRMNSSYNVYVDDNRRSYPDLNHNQKHVFSIGNYPIIQFYNKEENKVSVAFAQRDYAISSIVHNGKQQLVIRNSTQLNEIYDYYREFHSKTKRFQRFEGFKSFIFNYDYQLTYQDKQGKKIQELLLPNGFNIPWYIQRFKQQFQDSPLAVKLNQRQQQIQKFIPKPSVYNQNQGKQKLAKLRKQIQINEGFADIQEISGSDQIIFSSLLVFIKYKSNISNRREPLWFKFPNLISILHQQYPSLFENKVYVAMIEEILANGLFISSVDVFGKEDRAFQCIKCLKFKHIFLYLDSSFKESSKILWKVMHLNALNQFLYHSKQKIKLNKIIDLIQPVPIEQFQFFRLVTGSEEVQITISSQFKQFNLTKCICFIRIDAYSYSSITGILKTITSKKLKYLHNAKLEFYKLHDVDPNNECDIFDKYIYQTIKVWISIEQQKQGIIWLRKEIEWSIPNLQRLVRYHIRIQQQIGEHDNEPFTIIVQDVDYKKKKAYFDKS